MARKILIAALLIGLPTVSHAIQLHWASGASNLTFTEATRCTLIVQADPAEGRLPDAWRLLWASDGAKPRPVPLAIQSSCQSGAAEVSDVSDPTDPREIAANLVDAKFCRPPVGVVEAAIYVFDLPGGTRGRFEAVALDPADPDSNRVLKSAEATFNDGVAGTYPALLLHASHYHASAVLRVQAAGVGLARGLRPQLVPSDGSPPQLLTVVQQTDTALTAETTFPAALPASELLLNGAWSGGQFASVTGDSVRGTSVQSLNFVYYMDPDTNFYPKDFAFIFNTVPTGTPNVWQALFHLIYTRAAKAVPSQDQVTFGHAWTSRPDISTSWQHDVAYFSKSSSGWDGGQIYAPTVVTWAGRQRMFYTGRDANGTETIGYASKDIIDTGRGWDRQTAPVVTANVAHNQWIEQGEVTGLAPECRDPFVMVDPAFPDSLLMWFVARNRFDASHVSVGVAIGSLDSWRDLGYYRSTDRVLSGGSSRDESPHVFPDPAYPVDKTASQALWRLMFTDGPADPEVSIRFEGKSPGPAVSDTSLGNWATPSTVLFSYLSASAPSAPYGWEATEFLRLGEPPTDFIGGYDGDGIAISRVYWSGVDFALDFPSVTAVGGPRRSTDVGLAVSKLIPGVPRVGLRIELPAPMRATLAIYDVMGRRVSTVLARELLAGRTSVEWDGHDGSGMTVSSGIYFARLTCSVGARVVRVPLIR